VELEPLFQEMEEAYRTEQHSALFPILAGWRFAEALCPRAEARTGAGTPQAIAESARFLLDRTFTQDIYVNDLAQRLGVTRSTLFRHFRSCYGRSPKQYLLALRLDQAKRLLLQTSASIKEIAAACGFHSAHYLCRVFQRETGVSPRVWQQRHR
jgi:transcriptional regulator GlxA family with amidase domain